MSCLHCCLDPWPILNLLFLWLLNFQSLLCLSLTVSRHTVCQGSLPFCRSQFHVLTISSARKSFLVSCHSASFSLYTVFSVSPSEIPATIHDLQLCFLLAALLDTDLGLRRFLVGLIQVWSESGLIWFHRMWISSFVGMNVLPQLCILGPSLFLSCLSHSISPSVSMPVLRNFDYHSFVMYVEMTNTVFPGLFFFRDVLIPKFLLWFCILGLFFCLRDKCL